MNSDHSLTERPIPALVRMIAIPACIGFFFNTMYNVVDSIFAGYLSTTALAALGLSFPVFFIILAIGSGIGSGTTALSAHDIGAGDKNSAQRHSGQALTLTVILSIIITIAGIVLSPFLFTWLGAEGSTHTEAVAYMQIIFYGAIFFMLSFVCNAILNAIGDTKSFSNVLILGFVLNCFLNPLLMFGYGPFPELGFIGIAWATVVIQALGAVLLFRKVLKQKLIPTNISLYRPQLEPIKALLAQSIPASISMMSVGIGIFIITYFISKYGDAAVAAYGVATRIEQLILLPTIGLNIAVLTLVGQNFGAKKFDRVQESIKTSLIYGAYISILGFFLLQLTTPLLMGLFTKDIAVLQTGIPYLRMAGFLIYSYVVLFTVDATLRGFKRPQFSLYMGLTRQVLLPLTLLFIFSTYFTWGIWSVWVAVGTTVLATSIFSYIYLKIILPKILPKTISNTQSGLTKPTVVQ